MQQHSGMERALTLLLCLFCPVWIIYEQVMIAALDCSRDDLALVSSYLSSRTLLSLESLQLYRTFWQM